MAESAGERDATGRRAPSSRNIQPWDFVVVTDRRQLVDLSTVWQGAGHVATSAATIALVAPVPKDERQRDQVHYDLGQKATGMMIAAAGLGMRRGPRAGRSPSGERLGALVRARGTRGRGIPSD